MSLFLKKETLFIFLSFIISQFSYVPFLASLALVCFISCSLQFRLLIQELPGIILGFVGNLGFSGVLLPCVMLRIGSEGRNLVEVSGTAFSLTHCCLLPHPCLGMAFQLHSLQRVSLPPSPSSPLPCSRSNQEPSQE